MTERLLSYGEYRRLREAEFELEEPPPEEDLTDEHAFYQQDPADQPETDDLMAQYSDMQQQMQEINPTTPEYGEHLASMTELMDRLIALNPSDAIRGEAQRLRSLSGEVDLSQLPQVAAEHTASDIKPMSAADKLLSYGRQAPDPAETARQANTQARADLQELAGIYGIKVVTPAPGKVRIQKPGGMFGGGWQQDFPDFASAMQWAQSNMAKISKR